jgi:ABC-type glycerol-3-phosphate transport system substrate-binding protein
MKTERRWRLLCRLCSSVLLVLLVAGTPVAASEHIRVFLWKAWATTTAGTLGRWFEIVKEELQRRQPGLEVEYQHVDGGADPIIVAVAGGVAPDVAIASINYAFDLYDQGLLLPLSDYWNLSDLAKYDFFPSSQIYNQKDGVIFGAPWSMEATSIIYNAEMMEMAGLDPDPNAITSWDGLVEAAKKLLRTESDRVVVAGFNTGLSVPMFAGWLYANGGRFYNQDFDAVAFNDQHGRQAMTFLADLLNVHRLSGPAGIPAFHAGQVGMMTYQFAAGTILSDAPFRVGQTDFPPGPSGTTRSTVGWSNMFVIPAAAKNPDLGWAWIETMLSPAMQAKLAELFEPMSPYRQAFASSAARESIRQKPYLANTAEILARTGPYPYIRYVETTRAANPLLAQVTRGELAPTTAVTEMARIIDQILAGVAKQP